MLPLATLRDIAVARLPLPSRGDRPLSGWAAERAPGMPRPDPAPRWLDALATGPQSATLVAVGAGGNAPIATVENANQQPSQVGAGRPAHGHDHAT